MEISERRVDTIDIKREVFFGKRRAFSTMQRGHRAIRGGMRSLAERDRISFA